MVGGADEAVARARPVLEAMGTPERIVHIGPSGSGQLCKVCNQMVIGGTLAAVSEAFALARKAGVDPARVRNVLLGGFASSRVLDVHGERIINSNYVPGFRSRLFAKDLGIAADTLAEYETPAPVAAVVQQLVAALMASGHADDDYSALATVLFDLARVDRRA
jgi:2-hydroxy-3-oxopropionate reductase